MTDQEVFDKVVTALREQGCKSMDDGACVYRSKDGRKCAVGHLIPDELYHERMEGKVCFHLCRAYPGVRRLGLNMTLVLNLQRAHDHFPVEAWENKWADIANRHGLKYTPPERTNND